MTNPLPDYGISFNTVTAEIDQPLTAMQHAVKFMRQQIADPNYTHQLEAAQLWAVKKDNTFHLLKVHPDVYELLESNFDLYNYQAVIIHSTGWAAPLAEEGESQLPPSKDPRSKRVALACCVSDSSVGSALSFMDEDEIVEDPGTASGSLAEAMLSFWENNSSPF